MQLALDIKLQENATLGNFCWHGNEVLAKAMCNLLSDKSERLFYLWGQQSVGKTHLLQAAINLVSTQSLQSAYFPLQQVKSYGVEILEGVEALGLVCIDDVDSIAGNRQWEEALFHLYNRIRDQGQGLLFIAGKHAPTKLDLILPDLKSRLAWGMVFQIHELSEENKTDVLQKKAQERGFTLPSAVCHYLIHRCSRDMHNLIQMLAILDNASLAAKRKLTVPFVKQILSL